MPSFSARLVSFVLRTTGYYKRMFASVGYVQKNLVKLRATPSAPAAKWQKKLEISNTVFQGRTVWHIDPKETLSKTKVLYFHGGGYVFTAASAHWDFMGHMAEKHGVSFVAPLYPLGPEAHIDEIIDYALALYRDVLTRHDARDIVVGGDSAGGGLTASLMARVKAEGLPLPAGTILICPWLDMTMSHPDQIAIEKRDAILGITGLRAIGPLLAPDVPGSDVRLSPIHHDYQDFPPTLMFGGGDDILVTDARALKAKQPAIEYQESKGMIHVWPVFIFPESRVAQADMARFIGRVTA
ncbi:MAG: alpha/beta hydrolase fold domain-containing protein [Chakrabartia sp.]